ncbi:MAG: protein kinase domain-containing protein [Kofleriaceae bacterium]
MARYPQPGTVLLEKYRVLSLIGEGGMGAVLKARHIDLDEDVAIKCLLPHHLEREDIVRRFLREAKAAVKLKGKHVARVLDVGRLETGIPYIVMEFLDGADLNAIIKHHGAQDPAVAVDLMLQACEAIAEAHSIGIIHRDIKASNFFVSQPENQAPHLKVLDFGIATAPEGTSDLTSTQSVLGTPAYMAPEQMRSSKTSDARSDIWSIGVVMFELLEGGRPFRSEVYSELCLKVGMDPPLPITNPNVPEALTAVVMHCLEKSVERRYQSIAELAFDLMPFASDPVFARAYAEQCARLLGRRSYGAPTSLVTRHTGPITPVSPNDLSDVRTQFTPGNLANAGHTPGHLTPPNLTPSNLTPGSLRPGLTPANLTPAPSIPTLLGRPTPMPSTAPKTPTSIQASSGQLAQLAPRPKRRGRGLVIGVVAASMIVIVGAAMFAIDRGTTSTASEPAAAKPSKSEPAAARASKTEPVLGTGEPTATEPTNDVKVEPVLGAEDTAKSDTAAKGDTKGDTTNAKNDSVNAKNASANTDTTSAAAKKVDPATKSDPAVTKTEPAVTKTQPAVTKTEPAVTKTQPAVTKTEPAVTKTQPAVTKTEPAVTKTEPVVKKTAPVKKTPVKKDPTTKDPPRGDDGDIYGKRE